MTEQEQQEFNARMHPVLAQMPPELRQVWLLCSDGAWRKGRWMRSSAGPMWIIGKSGSALDTMRLLARVSIVSWSTQRGRVEVNPRAS